MKYKNLLLWRYFSCLEKQSLRQKKKNWRLWRIITISLTSDDRTFEQVKKQLNRSVEVIKVVDYTEVAIHMKELMVIKVSGCSKNEIEEIFRISQVFHTTVIDYERDAVLIESVKTENSNNDLIALLGRCFANRIEIVRSGSVAIEALSITDRQ